MTAPLQRVIEADIPAVALGADDDTIIGQAPFTGAVTAVQYIPETTVTGVASNNRTVSLVNKGQAGAGTTTIASLNFGAGVTAAANDDRAIPLSGTASDLNITEGDTLQWRSIHIGTGIADPGGLVRVTMNR